LVSCPAHLAGYPFDVSRMAIAVQDVSRVWPPNPCPSQDWHPVL